MYDFWFMLFFVLAWFFSVTDAISTYVGLQDGLKEKNGLFQKVLGAKLFNFLFVTPFGVFVKCSILLALLVGFLEIALHLGHAHNADAWVPGAIATGFLATTIRNVVLIEKAKKVSK